MGDYRLNLYAMDKRHSRNEMLRKKIIFIKILFLIFCTFAFNNVFAVDVTINGISYSLDLNNRTASVTGSTLEDVVVPEKIINDNISYTVTEIAAGAFTNNTAIKSFKAMSIKTINSDTNAMQQTSWGNIYYLNFRPEYGNGTFQGANNLEEVILGDALETIGGGAFYHLENLTKICVGNSLKRIESKAFQGCIKLEYIVIPSTIDYINDVNNSKAFYNCPQLTIVCLKQGFSTGLPSQTIYPNSFFTFDNNMYTYNGQVPEITYSFNGIGHGFQPTSVEINGIPFTSGLHTVNLNCTFANNDMSFDVKVPYEYTINPVTLTANVINASREYGEANPQFSSIYSGFVNNEDASVLTSHGTYTTTANATSDVGTYTIKQTGATAQNYVFEYVDGTLTVNKAPLTMTANSKSITYGGTIPTLDAKYDGLKNNETIPVWNNEPLFSTTATSASKVGTYPITISDADAKNYQLTIKNGTLSISKAELTIKADDKSRLYGEDNPNFTLSYTGLMNNETAPEWEKQPTIESSSDINSPVGTYPISVTDAVAVNYNITAIDGALTVNKATLQVTPNDVSRKYGAENPAFTLSYSGLKNNENAPEWTTTPTIITNATKESSVGDYAIQVTSAEAKNYTLDKKVGTLTITKAPLSVGINSYNRKYGEANPTFELHYTGLLNGETTPEWIDLPTITTQANDNSDVGEYSITSTGGVMKNYETSNITAGTLTITPASLTIKANNASRFYFEDNPELSFSCTGFVGNDDSSSFSTMPQIKTDAIKTSKVGLYAIEISGAVSKNYTLSYEKGQLTINKRQLTVSTENYTREYGEENPIFQLSYNGFVNNEGENVLLSKPQAITEATSTTDVGVYDITIANGVAENYYFNYINGQLTIEKAYQTLTWDQDLSNIKRYDQVELTAKASSELEVTYSIEGKQICTITKIGKKQYLDCNNEGEAVIVAVQEGNKNYWQTTKIYKNITIKTASPNSYTLTYIVDEKTYKTTSYKLGEKITPEPAPTKEGYTFSGWSGIPDTMPDHDVTVTGTFAINKYKLIYLIDDVEYKAYQIEYGATITAEAEPTKEGYLFSGWSNIPKTMPAHDVTVTGSFKIDDRPEIIVKIDDLITILKNKEKELNALFLSFVEYKTFVQEHYDILASNVKEMSFVIYQKVGELEALRKIGSSEQITQEDVDKLKCNELLSKADELMDSFKKYLTSITFSCGVGGKITVGDVVISKGQETIYWFYTLSPFKITVIPEDGYHISKIELDGHTISKTEYYSNELKGESFSVIFEKDNKLNEQLESIEKMRKTISETRQFMKDVKAEIANGKNYEVNSAKGIEEAFNDMNNILDEVEKQLSSYENRIKEGDKISEEDLASLKDKCYEIANFDSYFKNYEQKVVLSCNEGGSLTIGMTSVRNETKTIYWLYGKAFAALSFLTGRTGYGSILGDVEVTPDEGYKIASVTKNGAEVTNLNNLYGEGDIVAVFEKVKPVEVKAISYTREYGDPNPEFEYTMSDGSLTGTPEITCEATETSQVGDYPIVISSGTIQNENVTFVNGTLTITKAPLKVTARSFTIKQGDEMPVFEALYSGFKNNETSTVLIEQPKFNCNATSLSAPGSYDIEVSGASATNYEVSYENGTLTITPGTFKITYMVDGEIYKEYEIEYGATITPEAEPTKEGFEFSGWSWIPSKMPAEDVTITGTFKQIDFKIDNVTYEISGDGTVTIKGGDQNGSIEISGTVVINGQTYNVTAIADNAFKDNTQITSVTIAEGIQTIGENAFSGCIGLMVINIGKDVTSIGNKAFANVGTMSAAHTRSAESSIVVNCYAESVPQTANDAFENTPISTGMLLVNDNVIDAYKTTSPWSGFGKIQGFQEAAGINSINIDSPNARIYDMQGNRVNNTNKGINIIKMDDGTVKKIMVK